MHRYFQELFQPLVIAGLRIPQSRLAFLCETQTEKITLSSDETIHKRFPEKTTARKLKQSNSK